MESRLLLSTFLVTNTGDNGGVNPAPGAGTGTLRQALIDVNAATVPATIDFQIGSGGFQTIFPLSPLPTITNQVTIDGTSQPGYTTSPLIAIVGTSAGPNANGLTISGGGSTVQGLEIVGFRGNGIDLNSKGMDVIVSNLIGTDGHFGFGNGGSGVLIDDVPGNVIGTSVATGNVLSGNGVTGLTISGGGATGNLVQGNLIGTDASGFNPVPNVAGVVIIDAPGNTIGGTVSGAGNVISGNGFSSASALGGILIVNAGATGNLIEGNKIGTTEDGKLPLGNVGYGITLTNSILTPTVPSASGNTIGGTAQGAGNLISGNSQGGIAIFGLNGGGMNNVVQGNKIGTDVNGIMASAMKLPNLADGVFISNAADNTIGGPAQDAANVIAGNGLDGIEIRYTGATCNLVQGNYIGTNSDGTPTINNVGDGVLIEQAAQNTIIGCTISGNSGNGIEIFGSGTNGTVIQGNRIGTLPSGEPGESGLGNFQNGILINGSPANTIGGMDPGAGNLISGNDGNGILIENENPTAKGNLVEGNLIGTDATGEQALSNVSFGVEIAGASNNTIGGTTPFNLIGGAGNLISGNGGAGIQILGNPNDPTSATGNLIEGNYIGTKASGSGMDTSNNTTLPFISNAQGGIEISGASGNVIGGSAPDDRNVISGNEDAGVLITEADGNEVEGNYIGPDNTGLDVIGNVSSGIVIDASSSGNTIGGSVSGDCNVISGNIGSAITLQRRANNNLIEGNFIGPDKTGKAIATLETETTVTQGNIQNGISFVNIAYDNTITGNVISGNDGDGINFSSDSYGNQVLSNKIGVDVSGTQALGNFQNGVSVNDVSGNTIGGTTAGAGNIISGNNLDGILISEGVVPSQTVDGGATVLGTIVRGNFIGTNVKGNTPIGNGQNGISLDDSPYNTIGGTMHGAANIISGNDANIISGNDLNGISFSGANAMQNQVLGNLIGTDATGTSALANAQNGILMTDAPDNVIGGTVSGAANTISGNASDGISLTGAGSKGNLIEGDFIGTNSQGTGPLRNGQSNGQDGVAVFDASGDTVGGTVQGARNVISGNHGNGISFTGTLASDVVGNFIGTNVKGTQPVANVADGVLFDDSTGDIVGGTARGAGNVISGNRQAGVEIRGTTSRNDVVEGNTIGPAVGGKSFVTAAGDLGNLYGVYINGSAYNTVGGTNASARNLISGNSRPDGSGDGVLIAGPANLIEGNFIGTDQSGGFPLGNDTGVFINGAAFNTIGGTVQGAGNVIAGYSISTASVQGGVGVDIANAGASANLVEGNLIGTDATGKRALVPSQQPASGVGVLINNTTGSNTIGGVTAAARNVISGFVIALEIYAPQSSFNLVPGNTVEGNYIGTNALGVVVAGLGNTTGIFVNGVPLNTIGGTARGAGNVISGNTTGIYLLGPTTSDNLVQGNYIGLDPTGTSAEPNLTGIFVNDAMNNTIGGTAPGAGNVIAGNLLVGQVGSTGIYFYSGAAGNLVQGNLIGTNASGKTGKNLGLGDYGILLYNAPRNTYPTAGKGANTIRGSGIAATREFSSSAPLATTSGTTSKGKAKSVPSGPRALVRRPRSRK